VQSRFGGDDADFRCQRRVGAAGKPTGINPTTELVASLSRPSGEGVDPDRRLALHGGAMPAPRLRNEICLSQTR
jgi:hypothetical protein